MSTYDYTIIVVKGEKIGFFSKVTGSGSTALFYLMIDKRYQGQISFATSWRYTSNSGKFDNLSAFFGDYITVWNNMLLFF